MNKAFIAIVAVFVLVGGFFLYQSFGLSSNTIQSDYKNTTYTIDGKPITLVNGISEEEAAPGSASKIVTKYFGNEVRKDLNSDGIEDTVFLITQNQGGSGTFYYVVAAVSTNGGFKGTSAYFLGDRISPQTTEIKADNIIVVNYADRAPTEAMATPPSIGKTVYLSLDTQALQLKEVSQNGGGTTDVSALVAKSWVWDNTTGQKNDVPAVKPKKVGTFVLTFTKEGRFTATTDCNQVAGSYTTGKNNTISFGSMIATKMYCEGSQESYFTQVLADSTSFHFTDKGELILDLKFDSGGSLFTPKEGSSTTAPGAYETRLNQELIVGEIKIKPTEVLEDSRCPADVVCIQAGTVRVKAVFMSGSKQGDQIFILNKPVVAGDQEVTLTQVEPYPYSSKTISKGEYIFHFTITKK